MNFVFMDCINTSAPKEIIKTIVHLIGAVEENPGACIAGQEDSLESMFPYLLEKDGDEYIACFFPCNQEQRIHFEQLLIEGVQGKYGKEGDYFNIYFIDLPDGVKWETRIGDLYRENGYKKIGKRTKTIKEYTT